MSGLTAEVHEAGRVVRVSAAEFHGRTVVATGRWLRKAFVLDDEFLDGDTVSDLGEFLVWLKRAGLKADVVTFAQKLPDVAPKFSGHLLEYDSAAIVPITTYADWLANRAAHDVRKSINRAKRMGVIVKECEFNDQFVEGICGIYNESPVRQGSAFWHYQKDFETVKRENSTFLDRSAFIGAYFGEELIGFIRMVYVGHLALTLQVISKKSHFDKKPMSALIAKAIELCEAHRVTHLVYGSFTYNGQINSLTEFKRRNGFEEALLPRYYAALTMKGKLALALRLHHGAVERIPPGLRAKLKQLRSRWLARKTPEQAA